MTASTAVLVRFALAVLLARGGIAAPGLVVAAVGPTSVPSLYARPWRWTTELGQARTFADWRGQTLVVAPFFTSCQVRCPQTVRKLLGIAEAYRRAGRRATFLLVTLDPENDTPERLQRFKERDGLPAEWHLLSGSADDTRGLADFLETRAAHDTAHIDHQVRIAVFDGRGQLARNLHGWDFDAALALVD
jgi:protein SCO1